MQDVIKITMDLETQEADIDINVSGVKGAALIGLVGALEKVKSELLKGVKLKNE